MQCSTANDWVHYNCSGTFWLQSQCIVWCIATGLTAEVPVHCNWVHCRCSDACWFSSPWPVNNYSKISIHHFWRTHGGYQNKGCMKYLMCKKKKKTIKNEYCKFPILTTTIINKQKVPLISVCLLLFSHYLWTKEKNAVHGYHIGPTTHKAIIQYWQTNCMQNLHEIWYNSSTQGVWASMSFVKISTMKVIFYLRAQIKSNTSSDLDEIWHRRCPQKLGDCKLHKNWHGALSAWMHLQTYFPHLLPHLGKIHYKGSEHSVLPMFQVLAVNRSLQGLINFFSCVR